MVLAIGFLLLVSLVASSVLSFVGAYVSGLLPGWEVIIEVINNVVAFGVTSVVFAFMFMYLPAGGFSQPHVCPSGTWTKAHTWTAFLGVPKPPAHREIGNHRGGHEDAEQARKRQPSMEELHDSISAGAGR